MSALEQTEHMQGKCHLLQYNCRLSLIWVLMLFLVDLSTAITLTVKQAN